MVLVYLPAKAFPGTLTFSVAWILKVPTPWLPPVDVLLKKVTAGLPAVTVRGYPIPLTGQVDVHDVNTVTAVIVEARGRVRCGTLAVVN